MELKSKKINFRDSEWTIKEFNGTNVVINNEEGEVKTLSFTAAFKRGGSVLMKDESLQEEVYSIVEELNKNKEIDEKERITANFQKALEEAEARGTMGSSVSSGIRKGSSENKSTFKEDIMVSVFYGGSFGETHLVHENFSLRKSENGKYYVYFPMDGYLTQQRANTLENILIVKTSNGGEKGKFEIIGLIKKEDFNFFNGSSISKPNVNKVNNRVSQERYIDENNISYDGRKLYEYYPGEVDCILFSIEANAIYFPREKMYIVDKEKFFDSNDCILSNKTFFRGQKFYFGDNDECYSKLIDLINDDNLWEKE